MKRIISLIICASIAIGTFSFVSGTTPMTAQAATYTEQLINKGFPKDYAQKLNELHQKYPNWIFEPLITGFDWQYAINQERSPHSDQVIERNSFNKATDYCNCSVCYRNGSYVVQEYPNWVSASYQTVEYYMDPRNWLNEKGIFQFESTAYDGTQTIAGIEEILSGTWMYKSKITYLDQDGKTQTVTYPNGTQPTYSESILRAANYSGMSAYYLASKIRQEVGGTSSAYADGASGKTRKYPGIYNYYNIAAYTGAEDGLRWAAEKGRDGYYTNCQCRLRQKATTNSAELAMLDSNTLVNYKSKTTGQDDGKVWYNVTVTVNGKELNGYIRSDLVDTPNSNVTYGRPWTDPDKSIFYGAKYISSNFSDQTSGYLQKFNVNPKSSSVFNHEYMRNVAAAASESASTYTAYSKAGILSVTKTFQIPVFKNMTSPPAPTEILSADGIKNGFKLTWSRVDKTTGYQIQYATRSDFGNAATIYGGATDTLSKTITGRAADTLYYVRIRTYKNVSGDYVWGEWSPTKTVMTFSVDPPAATEIKSITGTERGFTVEWSKVSDTTGYQVQYATWSSFGNASTVYGGNASTLSKAITGRAENTKYYVRIRTYKNINNNYLWGEWSEPVSVTTLAVKPPKATSITSVSGILNGFTVEWSKVDDTTGYQVQYATRSDFSNAATIYGGATDTLSKTITGRATDMTYYVRVRTYKNVSGTYYWGNWSEATSVKTLSVSAPQPTTITSADGIKNGFVVNWTKVDETTGYQIQYATRSDFGNAATIYGGATDVTSKTITGRAADATYYVRVRTYKNVSGEYVWGEWTDAVSVRTFSVNPPASTEIKALVGVKNGFTVEWSRVDDTTGYQVQFATRSDFSNAATIYGGATDVTSKTITGRAADTKYYVRLRTYKNIDGNYLWGEWCTQGEVVTL